MNAMTTRDSATWNARLNRRLAEAGVCSRREADALIGEGRVTVNGEVATVGVRVNDADTVAVDGEVIPAVVREAKAAPELYRINKPRGVPIDVVLSAHPNESALVIIGNLADWAEG